MRAGQKRGHWIWWAFPTLAQRGGDGNSHYTGADLKDVDEARRYASHPALRSALLEVFRTAATAFDEAGRADGLGPYHVLDAGFGRASDGQWIMGPVDSFKAWASATLFRELARLSGDAELEAAARAVLHEFRGRSIVYESGSVGTAGYTAGQSLSGSRSVLGEEGDGVTVGLVRASFG